MDGQQQHQEDEFNVITVLVGAIYLIADVNIPQFGAGFRPLRWARFLLVCLLLCLLL